MDDHHPKTGYRHMWQSFAYDVLFELEQSWITWRSGTFPWFRDCCDDQLSIGDHHPKGDIADLKPPNGVRKLSKIVLLCLRSAQGSTNIWFQRGVLCFRANKQNASYVFRNHMKGKNGFFGNQLPPRNLVRWNLVKTCWKPGEISKTWWKPGENLVKFLKPGENPVKLIEETFYTVKFHQKNTVSFFVIFIRFRRWNWRQTCWKPGEISKVGEK